MSRCPTVIQVYPPCPTPCPDTPEYTFENANLAGEGVFFQKVGNTVSFYGIENTDGTIVVTLDATNKAISLDLNAELVAGSFPDATTTSKGKVELGTDGEAVAKTSTDVVVTPSNFAAMGATTSFAGFIEIATEAEAIDGSSTTLAITPATAYAIVGSALRMGLSNGTTLDTTFSFNGAKFELTSGAGLYRFNGSGFLISGEPLILSTGGDLNLNGAKVKFAGTDVTASSLLGTTGTAGEPTSYPLTGFFRLGEANTSDSVDTTLTVSGGGSVSLLYGTNGFTVASTGTYFGGLVNLGSSGRLNFDGSTPQLSIAGVDVPADSFVRTDSAAGVLTSELVASYFGPHNPTEDYTVAAYIANRGFDPATVTLPNLAIIVATLLSDLAAVKKPNMV